MLIFRVAPTWDTESNSDFEKHKDRLPFPLAPMGREGWGERGISLTHRKKPKLSLIPVYQAALDADVSNGEYIQRINECRPLMPSLIAARLR